MARIGASEVDFSVGRLKALDPNNWPALRRALMSLMPYESAGCPTAAVDEWWRCYYNPAWFATRTAEQAAAILVHEVWHLLRFHFVRGRTLTTRPEHQFLLNLAADAEIHEGNEVLLKALQTMPDGKPITRLSFDPPLPEGGIMETWFHELLHRESTREIKVNGETVAFIPKMKGVNQHGDQDAPTLVKLHLPGCGGSGGSGACGVKAPWEFGPPDEEGNPAGLGETQTEIMRRATAEDIKKHRKSQGTQDAGMLRWADEIINPVVDWRTCLQLGFQGVMSPLAGNRFWTYKKPSRRTPHDPRIVLPGWVDPLQRVAVLIDTSGSMSDDMLGLCLGEVTRLLSTLQRNGQRPFVRVYACDAKSTEAQTVWAGSEVKLIGGGGTDLTVGFKKIEADMHSAFEYDLVVCMTDGYTPWPKTPFRVPVVTVLMSDGKTATWLNQPPHKLVKVNMVDVLRERAAG